MANRDAWVAGNGVGLTWTACFATADLASLASGSSVLSSQGDISNGTNLDIYADVAVELTIASTTLVAGAAMYVYLFPAFQIDGSTTYYGDNSLPSGTQKAWLPPNGLVGSFAPSITGAAQTLVTGLFPLILLPPGTFRFAFGNNLGVAPTSGTQYGSYRTYNLNLNN